MTRDDFTIFLRNRLPDRRGWGGAMNATALVLASALLASAAIVATPGAAAIECTGGIPPQVDITIQCVMDLKAWAEAELRELLPPGDLLA